MSLLVSQLREKPSRKTTKELRRIDTAVKQPMISKTQPFIQVYSKILAERFLTSPI